ncbi:MAG: ABC transporter permease subunit [Anaerolineales bacterium]|jgi:putative spermidine/putrescine transport system permease protein|uniref:ABC transporter permease n=1 Tax=Candidatus Villigracilis affinis TaxID=3140682 RepID=UPI001B43F04C|nr:ABC transporter permease subunit [Anaerolineales bacterium]MBK9601645.1 ABC transporter permease subunit [Anaerolineales bacterium]MBL0345076.1 ABC transporter permease subunit [Anaerolineales bacterium]MBP8047202.1 ABC transporter permease subunit [Anaerolineales bacterium]
MAQTALNPKAPTPALDWKKWIGVTPFFLFAILFLVLPSMRLIVGSFTNSDGQFTFANIFQLFQEQAILDAYWLSIRISAATAIGGGIFGFLLAYSVTVGGLPKPLRSALITFSGVASNFAGVPLAFAFIATLGRTGFVTALIKNLFGVNLYQQTDFDLYSFWGLSLTYMYFQFPLMVLIMAPALDGLKREWREAAENLGASTGQYWLRVAFPVLLPSILGSMILLFGNAFGAYATAYALTGGRLGIITIQIGAQIRGDVLHNPGLGYAMAMGMVVVMTISLIGYSWLQKKSERWLR